MDTLKNLLTLSFSLGTLFVCNACDMAPKQEKILVTQALGQPRSSANNTVKIALLLDTSNSMDGLINQAKSQLWDIVNKFTYAKCGNARPKLEIALYQYGNDGLASSEGYIQQVLGFSSDLDEISAKLFSLTTNGGEEFCGQVINTSLKQLDWGKNPDHLKMIFIAGNEPFTQGKLDYKDAVSQAKEKDVVVNTIFCGSYEQGIATQWKDGAQRTGGEYMAIDHNQQVVQIATPYDKKIIDLNQRLNSTYVSYGAQGSERKTMQAVQDSNAQELDEVVVVKRAVSKSSRMYRNSSWDLVDAVADDIDIMEEISEPEMPQELQGKTKEERVAFLAKKSEERKAIQTEIQALNGQREAYITTKTKEDSKGELENAMFKAIEKQAALKNYKWE